MMNTPRGPVNDNSRNAKEELDKLKLSNVQLTEKINVMNAQRESSQVDIQKERNRFVKQMEEGRKEVQKLTKELEEERKERLGVKQQLVALQKELDNERQTSTRLKQELSIARERQLNDKPHDKTTAGGLVTEDELEQTKSALAQLTIQHRQLQEMFNVTCVNQGPVQHELLTERQRCAVPKQQTLGTGDKPSRTGGMTEQFRPQLSQSTSNHRSPDAQQHHQHLVVGLPQGSTIPMSVPVPQLQPAIMQTAVPPGLWTQPPGMAPTEWPQYHAPLPILDISVMLAEVERSRTGMGAAVEMTDVHGYWEWPVRVANSVMWQQMLSQTKGSLMSPRLLLPVHMSGWKLGMDLRMETGCATLSAWIPYDDYNSQMKVNQANSLLLPVRVVISPLDQGTRQPINLGQTPVTMDITLAQLEKQVVTLARFPVEALRVACPTVPPLLAFQWTLVVR